MHEHDNEALWRKIANEYSTQYGKELLDEAEALNAMEISPSELRLEARVQKQLATKKRARYVRFAPIVAAACIALVFFLPGVRNAIPGLPTSPVPSAPGTHPSGDPAEFEIIPLSVPLPDGFTEAGFEQDLGKSVYYLDDRYEDDVVLTLEYTTPASHNFAGLLPIWIDGKLVYGTKTDGYCLLSFVRENVLYTLTCKHDINTLLRLGSEWI